MTKQTKEKEQKKNHEKHIHVVVFTCTLTNIACLKSKSKTALLDSITDQAEITHTFNPK